MLRADVDVLKEATALPAEVVAAIGALRAKLAARKNAIERQTFVEGGDTAPLPHPPEELARDAGALRVLLHSLAFGTLTPYIDDPIKNAVTQAQMDMTLDVMAHSLVYWTQEVVARGLMTRGGRIYAMTSSGSTRVLPAYGPVSAAKAALEAHIRQLAAELAPRGIAANAIRAGVTDTPALRKIPGHEAIIAGARRRNPSGRLTTPEDVARAIATLAHPDTYWITGNVIGVDGGEEIVG